MLKKVDKVFIGDYIERTTEVVDGATISEIQEDIVAKEIAILDSNYDVIEGASATFTATKEIYIAEGSAETFTTVNPAGTTISGRRLLLSGAIDGTKVVNYSGDAYAAKTEATATLTAITDTIVAGTEYVLRIVYTGDIAAMDRGQSTETYRYVAKTGDASTDVYDGLVARIAKRYLTTTIKKAASKLITATNSAGSLVITALPLPSCTSSVDDIDELVMNDFKVFLNYVDSDYNWTEVTVGSKTETGSYRGFGSWETVRDAEKQAQSYEGISNRIYFPVIKPAMRTVKDNTYDLIVIEHDRSYRSPDNQYTKETSLVELIALEKGTGATAPQNAEILVTLNTWMASLPKSFTAVSFA